MIVRGAPSSKQVNNPTQRYLIRHRWSILWLCHRTRQHIRLLNRFVVYMNHVRWIHDLSLWQCIDSRLTSMRRSRNCSVHRRMYTINRRQYSAMQIMEVLNICHIKIESIRAHLIYIVKVIDHQYRIQQARHSIVVRSHLCHTWTRHQQLYPLNMLFNSRANCFLRHHSLPVRRRRIHSFSNRSQRVILSYLHQSIIMLIIAVEYI
jgi:hypothetical protein